MSHATVGPGSFSEVCSLCGILPSNCPCTPGADPKAERKRQAALSAERGAKKRRRVRMSMLFMSVHNDLSREMYDALERDISKRVGLTERLVAIYEASDYYRETQKDKSQRPGTEHPVEDARA